MSSAAVAAQLASLAICAVGCGAPAAPGAAGGGSDTLPPLFDAEQVRRLAVDGGKPVVVSLWATWCEPCIAEMPVLSAFQAAHPQLVVLGLATDDVAMPAAAARIRKILSERQPAYAQGRLPESGAGAFLEAFGAAWDGMLPWLVVVRPDGTAALAQAGAVDAAALAGRILAATGSSGDRSNDGAAP